jgi:hypothetical protein
MYFALDLSIMINRDVSPIFYLDRHVIEEDFKEKNHTLN